MALKAGIEVNKVDIRKLHKKISALEKYPKGMDKIIKHEAENAVGRMKKEAPVDTGRLRREIEVEPLNKKTVLISSVAIDPRTGIDYAPIREYGLDGNVVQPYFRRNIDLLRIRLQERVVRLLKELTTNN